ncbi:MAG: molybdenum cofactor guanylyltransferase [Chloroflexota bacterium]|nr:molybdenum cofactor guanylyltransferase [Chloroflexota bacterium]MDE2958812.1 molybdenum cofactor guanylyltransferase [Chloroflexota bacterium]
MNSVDNTPITAVILAGGQSRRLGRDKAIEPFDGEPLIRRVIRRASEAVSSSQVIVVVADPERTAALPLDDDHLTAVDVFPDCGSLGGIYTGLNASSTDWSLVAACDMPFLSAPLLAHMAGLRDGVDAVVPVVDGRPEPTHALYNRRCLPAIEGRLRAGQLKISGFFDDVAVRYVPEDDIRRFDPDLLSFFNINRPEDLSRAMELAR